MQVLKEEIRLYYTAYIILRLIGDIRETIFYGTELDIVSEM